MRACYTHEATKTQSEYVMIILLHCNDSCKNAPQCHAICTLPVLFMVWFVYNKEVCYDKITYLNL